MKTVLVRKSCKLGIATLLLAAAGCESLTGPRPLPEGVEFRTTSDVFPVQVLNGNRTVLISGRISNAGSRTVYYSFCSEQIAKQEGFGWTTAWAPVCIALLVPPEPIGPGESRLVTLSVTEHPGSSQGFPFQANEWYRIQVRLLLRAEAPYEEKWFEIDEGQSVSNRFRVTE